MAFPWKKYVIIATIISYLIILNHATLGRETSHGQSYNFHLFYAWRSAWNNFTVQGWLNIILNIVIFIPLGIMLPLLYRKAKKWYVTLFISFTITTYIEICQFLMQKGLLDIDDIFCNTVGALTGHFFITALLSIKSAHPQKHLIAGGKLFLSLIPALLISGIFIIYSHQEFGNLPDGMLYSVNTNNISWKLDCRLPDTQTTAVVYRLPQRTLTECDIFANKFKQIIGTEYTTVSYQQDTACYMDQALDDNGSHFLNVSYIDQGFTYSAAYENNKSYSSIRRSNAESVLSSFPVILSTYTHFTSEGLGWCCFSANKYIYEDANMLNGTLRCRIAEDGTVIEIDNKLHFYSYYRDAAIITPIQALSQLQSGNYKLPDTIKVKQSGVYSIKSCLIDYRTDTKGFYQPVYTFDIVTDQNQHFTAIIPALS